MRKHLTAAFTLVELMVVIAIVAILSAVSIPAYQDYVRRTRVAEALTLLAAAKTAIVENASTGLPLDSGITLPTVSPSLTPYISSMKLYQSNGALEVKFNPSKFNGQAYGIALMPVDTGTNAVIVSTSTESTIPTGNIRWSCSATVGTGGGRGAGITMPFRYLPEVCRNNTFEYTI